MNASLRSNQFEQAIALVAAPLRSKFAMSQVAFLMGAMEVINQPASRIMNEVVQSWVSQNRFAAGFSDHFVDQLMDQTGTFDETSTPAEYAAVQMAVCTGNILDGCSGIEVMSVETLRGIAYSVFDVAPYFGDESRPYSDSPGPVVKIIEDQQSGGLMRLNRVDAEDTMKLFEFSRMAGLRLKAYVPA